MADERAAANPPLLQRPDEKRFLVAQSESDVRFARIQNAYSL
jgi:hypothetical protein